MFGNAWQSLAGLGALMLSACASAPGNPPNMPPPLSFAEINGTPGIPRSDMIAPAGEAVVASGAVARDGSLISIPYVYKYTAVLTEDVLGFSFTVGGVQAPKGSPGFYAGTFPNPYNAQAPNDMWCFLPKVVGGGRDAICLYRNQTGLAAIAPTRLNPYMWFSFSSLTGSFDNVHTPIFERRVVPIPGDLRLEYRLVGWADGEVELAEFAVGREVHKFKVRRGADGSARLNTIAGVLVISPAPGNAQAATVKLEPRS
jgi:hypothetical protein